MTGQIILALVVALPLILGLVFRVSTSHLFFSLMAGELLARYFGHDIEHQAKAVYDKVSFTGYGEILLLTLPMILTAIFLKGSVSKGKIILHIIPLIITGLIYATFLTPMLPPDIQQQIKSFEVGAWILDLNKFIIGGMVAVQLVTLWLLNRGGHSEKGKHKSKA